MLNHKKEKRKVGIFRFFSFTSRVLASHADVLRGSSRVPAPRSRLFVVVVVKYQNNNKKSLVS